MSNNSNKSINGSKGRECQKFYSHLVQLISGKKDPAQSISSYWIRAKWAAGAEERFLLPLARPC